MPNPCATLPGMLQALLLASRRRRVEREVDRLLTLLAAVPDPGMRRGRAAEWLRRCSLTQAAWTLSVVLEYLSRGDRRAQAVALSLLDREVLCAAHGEPGVEAVRTFLREQGDPAARLLEKEAGGSVEEDVPPPREPVGYRVALARQPVSRLIDRLLFDPDPRVLRTLLANPRLTEADVVKLAASRRASAEALVTIASDDRWIPRYSVKLALVGNPRSPVRVVVGLLPFLLQRDLQDLALAGSHPEVRDRAAALLTERRGPGEGRAARLSGDG
jgi:hypothetical protein